MCGAAKEQGSVIIANLHHQASNLAYCEAIMDWWMIPRSECDMSELADAVVNNDNSWAVKVERRDCFCYLILEKL